MKNVVLLHKVRGEDKEKLKLEISEICNLLKKAGYSVYCTFLDSSMEGKDKKDLIKKSFYEIDKADIVLFYIKSEEKSEGMLIEFGYSVAKKKVIYLLIKKDLYSPYVRQAASKVIEFEDINSIKLDLKKLE